MSSILQLSLHFLSSFSVIYRRFLIVLLLRIIVSVSFLSFPPVISFTYTLIAWHPVYATSFPTLSLPPSPSPPSPSPSPSCLLLTQSSYLILFLALLLYLHV